jgi:hypothetical protein
VVAREFAADEEARGAIGASSVGRAAEIALRFLRGCLTSEVTTEGGLAGGFESEAEAAGGVDAGIEVANACDATTGWVYMLSVATEVLGCRGTGMSIGTRKYS